MHALGVTAIRPLGTSQSVVPLVLFFTVALATVVLSAAAFSAEINSGNQKWIFGLTTK